MGQITIGEQAAPAAPSSGVTIYPTIATPSILRWINDSGVDRAIAPWIPPTAWTPGITFGGGSTGLTHAADGVYGTYERLGNTIRASAWLELSAKGSSTGTALITGLPVAAKNVIRFSQPATIAWGDLTGITGMVQGFVSPNTTSINLTFLGTGTPTVLTHAHFTNTTYVVVQISYEVA